MDHISRAAEVYGEHGLTDLVRRTGAFVLDTPRRALRSSREGLVNTRDRYREIQRHVDSRSPTIVYGGPHYGDRLERLLEYFDDPTVHAFEPLPEAADVLRDRFESGRVVVHQRAVGSSTDTVDLNVTEGTTRSSSVLTPEQEVATVGETIEVEQVRIDDALSVPVDAIKLDVQGREVAALRGAEGVLDSPRAVLTEVMFERRYVGQPLFRDVSVFMADRGFAFHTLFTPSEDEDGKLQWGRALFVSDEPDGS